MSGWISSKLKVAESLLQQIDQQAAESLRKNETLVSEDDLVRAKPKKSSEILPPLKDQLKKKKKAPAGGSDAVSQLRKHSGEKAGGNVAGGSVDLNPKSKLSDGDWTELLSAPVKTTNGSNGGLGRIHGLRKDGKRQGRASSSLSALDTKRGQGIETENARKSDVGPEGKVNGDGSDGQRDSSDSTRSSSEKDRSEMLVEDARESVVVDNGSRADDGRIKELSAPVDGLLDGVLQAKGENFAPQVQSAAAIRLSDMKLQVDNDHKRREMMQDDKVNGAAKISPPRKTGPYSTSESGSDSESSSGSSSDSEAEREREERRKRREQILAEKAAAKAIEAIKERENFVARLEGEKQSLEKIIEERAKQQAQEASELQTTMMETMEAVDLEKQKHNNTRMEALARLTKLETTNAELARSLATAQWNLEVEVKKVAEVRRLVELKEASIEELTAKKNSYQSGDKPTASKGVEFEHEILEAEHTFVTDKIRQLQEKAKTLETGIETTQREMENPTEVEVELKRRLGQLTDHLIQKQAQVEALSSEKATLMFRIEAVSRSLEESKSGLVDNPMGDLESGIRELSSSRLKPMLEERLRKGQKQIGSLLRQLDSIFLTGSTFLKRNQTARLWSFVYLICLHLWVLYILKSHTPVSEDTRSGAVISLENINETGV